MGIIKVLKRKDGASLVVGVALGFAVSNFIVSVTNQLSEKFTYLGTTSPNVTQLGGQDWRSAYLAPIVQLVLAVIALELLIWVYVWFHDMVTKK